MDIDLTVIWMITWMNGDHDNMELKRSSVMKAVSATRGGFN